MKKILPIIAIIMIIALLSSCNQTETITCGACGADIPSDVKFCSECGANLAADSTLAPEVTQAPETTSEPEESRPPETTVAPETTNVPQTTKVAETTEAPHVHAWSAWTMVSQVTCIYDGRHERSCSCGEKETQTIFAGGHTVVIDQAVAATCEKDGKTEGKHCSTCKIVILTPQTVKATGHTYDAWKITKTATCTANGEQQRSCSCGKKETQSISALGHTEVIDKAVAATCEKDGKTEGKHCSTCNIVILTSQTVKATGHTYGAWEITKVATCTASGEQQRACSCGKKETQSVSVRDHNYVNRVCSVCGDQDGSKGLSYSLSADGTFYSVSLGTCTDANIIIPRSYNGIPVTSINTNAFYNYKKLISITIPDSVTSIGDFAFSYCKSLKSLTIPDSVTRIGSWAFQGCTSLTSVTISDSVTKIELCAFSNCYSLASVTIPDGVTWIEGQAFYCCTSLTSVTIPDSVTHIGESTFAGCTSLTSITVPSSVLSIGRSAFRDCTKLTNITISDGVTSIGDYAFRNCTNLTSITIPESVTKIGDKAFEGCINIKVVYYTGAVWEWMIITIGADNEFLESAIICCYSETAPTRDGDYWHYVNGVPTAWKPLVFPSYGLAFSINTDGKSYTVTGIGICTDTYVIIPAIYRNKPVTSIGSGAFAYCTSFTSIIVPDSVTNINNSAFFNCTKLTSITIPNSVTSIEGLAFYSCFSLKDVYYTGTEAEWKAITIGSINDYLTKATIHFNSKN